MFSFFWRRTKVSFRGSPALLLPNDHRQDANSALSGSLFWVVNEDPFSTFAVYYLGSRVSIKGKYKEQSRNTIQKKIGQQAETSY